jgi:hypothetical protein
MYSLIKVVAIYSGISILLLSTASAIAQPEVQEYYPQCDYKPLDVATVKRRVKYVNSQITDKKMANATQFLIKKLLRIASDKKAQAVLLIDREIDDKNVNYFYLSFYCAASNTL